MQLSWNEIENRALKFSNDWKNASDEKSQAQLFLNDFFYIFGMEENTICSNLVKIIKSADLYHFGVLESSNTYGMVKSVCGRLRNGYGQTQI